MLKYYKKIGLLLKLSLVFYVISCSPKHENGNNDPQKSPLTNEKAVDSALENPEEITFLEVKSLVLEPFCVRCHTSNGDQFSNVVLSEYDAVFGNKGNKAIAVPFNPDRSSIYNSLLIPSGKRHMPPFDEPQLNKKQINLIYHWLLNGAKLKVNQKIKRPKTLQEELQTYFNKPETIDYNIVNKYIFEKSCNECHSLNGSKADFEGAIKYGQDMTNYPDLFTNSGIIKDRINDYVIQIDGKLKKKKGSRIYKSIAINQTMPRSIDGYSPTNSLLVKLLRLWIFNCAIEDFSKIDQDTLIDPGDEDYDDYLLKGKIRDCIEPKENE